MNPLLKRIAGNTGFGLFSGVVILVAGIVRAILLGHYFDLSVFGYFVICINLVALARLFTQIGLSDTIFRFYPEFDEKGDFDALSSLVVLCGYVSLVVTLLIVILAWTCSPIIAESLYEKPDLSYPIMISAICSGGFLFSYASTALLRVQNCFHLAIIFPSIGACIGPLGIFLLHQYDSLSLDSAILVVGLGNLLGIVGTLGFAVMRSLRSLRFSVSIMKLEPLRPSGREIRSTLTQTSLFGVLQSSTQTGGIFLLGILGTPGQVAILGMSTQLSRPLVLFQTAISAATTPEVSRLHAEGSPRKLYRFITRYIEIVSVVVSLGLVVAWFGVPQAIQLVFKPEYGLAVPVFLVLLLSSGLMLIFQPLLPVAIARGEVGRRNMVVCFRFLYLAIACLAGLTAMGVALSILVGNLTVRFVNDVPLLKRLRHSF